MAGMWLGSKARIHGEWRRVTHTGGNGVVLQTGEGATAEEMTASRGGSTTGIGRDKLLYGRS